MLAVGNNTRGSFGRRCIRFSRAGLITTPSFRSRTAVYRLSTTITTTKCRRIQVNAFISPPKINRFMEHIIGDRDHRHLLRAIFANLTNRVSLQGGKTTSHQRKLGLRTPVPGNIEAQDTGRLCRPWKSNTNTVAKRNPKWLHEPDYFGQGVKCSRPDSGQDVYFQQRRRRIDSRRSSAAGIQFYIDQTTTRRSTTLLERSQEAYAELSSSGPDGQIRLRGHAEAEDAEQVIGPSKSYHQSKEADNMRGHLHRHAPAVMPLGRRRRDDAPHKGSSPRFYIRPWTSMLKTPPFKYIRVNSPNNQHTDENGFDSSCRRVPSSPSTLKTATCLAGVVGGRGQDSFNRAGMAVRQPGFAKLMPT